MKCETHSPVYDKQTGGSKCKKCGVLLNDFNQEYPEVKESCNDSGGDSPLNTAHPPTSENWKAKFKEWYINTSGQNYVPCEIIEAYVERYIVEKINHHFDKLIGDNYQLQLSLDKANEKLEYWKARCEAAEKRFELFIIWRNAHSNYPNSLEALNALKSFESADKKLQALKNKEHMRTNTN